MLIWGFLRKIGSSTTLIVLTLGYEVACLLKLQDERVINNRQETIIFAMNLTFLFYPPKSNPYKLFYYFLE